MKDTTDHVLEPERRVTVARTVDVVVAGGGPAGIAAGIAAAREGAKTLVIERYGYLGGMITGAHIVWILGVGDGIRPKARGITSDIRTHLDTFGAVQLLNQSGDYSVDAETFKWQAAELLEDSGAELLLHTHTCDPLIESGCVCGVFTESKSGRQAIRASVVIDCTADADITYRAGATCDNESHEITLRVVVGGVDRDAVSDFKEKHPGHHQEIIAAARALNGGVMPDQQRCIKGIDATDAFSLSRTELLLRRDCFRALYYLRENMPGWEKSFISETGPQIGIRQSRRIRGEYTLTENDLCSSRHFEDSVARLGSCLCGYKLYEPAGLDYDIPYRCLVPETMDGLLVAGRCISSDYTADNSLRLIVPCIATGQAAGVAAALAVRHNVKPRQCDIGELRTALSRQGVYLCGETPAAGADELPESREETFWDGGVSTYDGEDAFVKE